MRIICCDSKNCYFAGLENDIYDVVAQILPWFKEHGDSSVTEEAMRNLVVGVVENVMKMSSVDSSVSDLFKSQLSASLNEAFSQYNGSSVTEVCDEILYEVCEVLYDEFVALRRRHYAHNSAD